ncbi:hypothetical protein C6341_g24501 [Phytophthora cactorum]|nr:hypothetical protein C6341_g24501 [Phytophthora cactorum]
MKLWRMKIWYDEATQEKCPGKCHSSSKGGQEHMLWECPNARSLWEMWLRAWEWTGGKEDTGITAIFSLTLKTLPQWIVDWGQEQAEEYWDHPPVKCGRLDVPRSLRPSGDGTWITNTPAVESHYYVKGSCMR